MRRPFLDRRSLLRGVAAGGGLMALQSALPAWARTGSPGLGADRPILTTRRGRPIGRHVRARSGPSADAGVTSGPDDGHMTTNPHPDGPGTPVLAAHSLVNTLE